MKRLTVPALVLTLAIAPLAAQTPKGWMVRADKSTSATDPDGAGDIKFMAMGATSFHAVNPMAAVYWNPANTAKGNYTLKGSFKLLKPSGHANYYGLVLGGSELANAKQTYLYFLVAQNGNFMVSRRGGDGPPTAIVPRTPNAAVVKPGADGTSVNALEVRVTGDDVAFVVNGTVVHTAKKADLGTTTDGIVGLRVNHQLEVQIDGFGVGK